MHFERNKDSGGRRRGLKQVRCKTQNGKGGSGKQYKF